MTKLLTFLSMWIYLCPVTAQSVRTSPDWLDMKVPSIDVDGSWLEFARELNKLGVRVCIEDVVLTGMSPSEVQIRVQASDISLRDLLNQIVDGSRELGWEEGGFLMCRVITLFRREARGSFTENPLDTRIQSFSFQDEMLEPSTTSVSDLLYNHSPELRAIVNPKNLPRGARPGSELGGISTGGYRHEIRFSVEFENATLRQVLSALVCLRLNRGLNWHFIYRAEAEYPASYSVRLF